MPREGRSSSCGQIGTIDRIFAARVRINHANIFKDVYKAKTNLQQVNLAQ
jgi:hypothetical protein